MKKVENPEEIWKGIEDAPEEVLKARRMKNGIKEEKGRANEKEAGEKDGDQSENTKDDAKSTDQRESDNDSEDEAYDDDEEEDDIESNFSNPDGDLDDYRSTTAAQIFREENQPEEKEEIPDEKKIEAGDKGEEDRRETPDIKVMTISTRGYKNIKDPIKQVNESGVWPSEREATGYYHTHPDVYKIPAVQKIVEMQCGYLNIREGIPEEDFNDKPENQIEQPQGEAELGY